MAASSQKFIARNRAPRVQIEYEVELYGSEKKVQLPFVMGVMADLAGKPVDALPAVADRRFLEIDVDNFDERMRAMAPRVAFSVPNTLTGEGQLSVDITFAGMDDFSPAAIARQVAPLRKLLEARTDLSNLLTYMDGKTGAEGLVERFLQDPGLIGAVAADDRTALDATTDALAALRAAQPAARTPPDTAAAAFAALRAAQPVAEARPDATASALAALRAAQPLAETPPDTTSTALAALRAAPPATETPPDARTAVLAALRAAQPDAHAPADATAAALAALRTTPTAADAPPDATATALAALRTAQIDFNAAPDATAAALAALRAAQPMPEAPPLETSLTDVLPAGASSDDPLADLLADDPAPTEPDALAGLDDLLAEVPEPDPLADLLADDPAPTEPDGLAGLDDLLAAVPEPDPLADLEALLAEPLVPAEDDPLAGLDDLLGGGMEEEDDPLAGLDALLAEPEAPVEDPLAGLADLLASPDAAGTGDPFADLEALLADASVSDASRTDPVTSRPPPPVYGTISVAAPDPARLQRKVFRMAVFGDFTGRAASGRIETGDALAARRAIPFDVDTVEEVIESFATTLMLPIGPEGQGIAVELAGLESLHPDELVDSVALFEDLKGLRQRLSSSTMAAKAVDEVKGWGASFATPLAPASARSGASSVPADRRLSDFQRLIGDREGRLSQPSPVTDLIGRIVGPHVVPGPNTEARALRDAVDAAMAGAMRLILHHPEFQAIEAQWRSLDLMARRIETDVTLRIHLFDISAEELAADLAAHDDLARSGFFKLVNAPLTEDGETGFSALFGLYTFEETPPHADLLGRIATVASHVQAPFFTAMSPAFLDIALKDRHPLVASAWEALRADPVARWLGIAAPRFLLRRPYGARSEPIDAFDFEEFTLSEGLSGMLWGNPVVLVAVLLAEAWKQDGPKMELGRIMSVDDMPFHFATDRHGDQVALPCTERNVTTEKIDRATHRGLMPLVAPKARNEVRLASFRSVAGEPILGPWAGVQPALERRAPQPQLQVRIPASAPATGAAALDDDLDSLLAGFGDSAAVTDPNAIDADLAALLEGL